MIPEAPTLTTLPEEWRRWLPEAALAAIVLLVGLIDAVTSPGPRGGGMALVILLTATAVLLARHGPGPALGLVWSAFLLQLGLGIPVLTSQLAVAIVAFGCACWGSRTTLVLSGLSIPAAGAAGLVLVGWGGLGVFGTGSVRGVLDQATALTDSSLIGGAILALLVLVVPWVLGLAVRATERAQTSELQQHVAEAAAEDAKQVADQANEIARLREEQARLARDVHDVVGHSLAVILAQAESGQYLPDDPDRLKSTLATIATSARSSLQDVRHVLTATSEPIARPGWLDEMIDGVRAGGREVVTEEIGTAQPLPPELEVVAQRVLQEMLTNAVKHGERDRAITVERHWPSGGFERDLRIEVRNGVAGTAPTDLPGEEADGQGVAGMSRRLESVGGRLDVRRRQEAGGATFTVTAWLPVNRHG